MEKIWITLLIWIVVFLLSGGYYYIKNNKLDWPAAIGTATGFSIVYFIY